MRQGWRSKVQQQQVASTDSAIKRLARVGRMSPVPISHLRAASDLRTRGAQLSFQVQALEGIDSFVLVRNFSQDLGSAQVIHTWPAASIKATPQTFPIALKYADADPAIAGQKVYYWLKSVPVSTLTHDNIIVSDAQEFDASNLPSASQITGDFAATQAYTPTTQPLGALTGAAPNQATIFVAAFQVQYPFDANHDGVPDLVSYNSGSITPLNDSTTYYVYFDDPDYSGGPQAYQASTDNPKVSASLHRQYLGTIMTPAFGGGGTTGGGGGGGACFTGNTRIKTRNGWKPIAEIQLGEEVESLAGWVKVVTKLEHWYEGLMQNMQFGEYVTPEHRIWIERSWVQARLIWKDAKPFVGRVYNLHCEGKDDFERCYRLMNGYVAHNARKV